MQSLRIEIAESPDEAPNYNRDSLDIRNVTITKAIIVKRGTVGGKTTVDFQIVDPLGGQYVAMLTGALVRQLAAMTIAAEES